MTQVSVTTRGSSEGIATAVRSSLRQPGFVICTVVLAALTVCFYGMTRNVQFRKKAAPLKKELADLNKASLLPYEFKTANPIQPEVIDALGTDKYIDWILFDTSVPETSTAKRVRLFVTYYTGQPDQVPHVPDVCYQGGGYRQRGARDLVLEVPEISRSVPIRILEFEKTGRVGSLRPTVIYTFAVNNTFAADRTAVRLTINQPLETFAYFSKIEVQFDSLTGQPATPEEAVAATEKLFRVLLPELFTNHYPDWAALHARSEATATTTAK